MGFHTCEWCRESQQLKSAHVFSPYSSADVTLKFDNGHAYTFPHPGLLHYVTSHGYRPPERFILDVMGHEVQDAEYALSKGLPMRVGWLVYPDLEVGHVPDGFVEKLAGLVHKVNWTEDERWRQTRSAK